MTKFSGYSNQWGNEPWGALPGGQQVKGLVRRSRSQKTASEKFAPAALKHSENEASKGPAFRSDPSNPKLIPSGDQRSGMRPVRRGGQGQKRDDKGRFA